MSPRKHHVFPLLAVLAGSCDGASVAGDRCPDDMVAVEGGPFVMGLGVPEHFWDQPAREVDLGPYCIDRYEYPNIQGELPRNHVGWYEARRLCRRAGKRLCSSAEWERACRGAEGWRQAYGPERDQGACNTPLVEARPEDVPLAPSGSFPRCVSPEGAFDLNGSLSEWVQDPWGGPTQPFEPWSWPWSSARTQRGGTMWSTTFYGQDCLSTHGHTPRTETGDDGFRCCVSRELGAR